jgi:hypothetical protein
MQVTNYPETRIFELRFVVYNKNVDMAKLFEFDILNMLFAANNVNIIEQFHSTANESSEKAGETGSTNIQMLFYHLFKDCGIPRYYLNMDLNIEITDNVIEYYSTIRSDFPDHLPASSSMMRPPKPIPISKMNIRVEIPTPSSGGVMVSLTFNNEQPSPLHREKMVSMVFKKMFSRLKEFIENM